MRRSELSHNSVPHSALRHGQPLVRGRLQTALLALLWIITGVSLFTPASSAQTVQYPYPGCVATMENHSGLVDNNGNFVIPNIPASPGQYLVHVACPQADGSLLTGVSPYINLQAVTGGVFPVPLIPIGLPIPEPSQLVLIQLSGNLSAVGATAQLQAQAILPDGSPFDVTLTTAGTSYFSSNTAVATVDQNGVVTATGPGTVTISANNDGLTATIMLTSFSALDSDGDGMPDSYEIANGLNPFDPTDAALDPDGDGLTNLQEYQLGTNPHVYDTDGDGLSDGQEVQLGTNPLVADTDGDGLTDGQEVTLGTNPLNPDTDGDGIPDGVEVKIGTNPLVFDVTTTVTGNVSNGDGTPHPGASVVVLTYFTAQTDSSGTFTILNVPITLGNLSAQAEAVVGTQVYSGSSQPTVPVGNGSTNVGTISLGPNSGQVSGTIVTPDNRPEQGVQVTVTDGTDTRTATTDATGLYAVTGLKPGTALVSAFDPATSLRGQGTGTLNGKTPATVNIKLSAFGTVSGTVTNIAGTAVGAGVTVTISGALNTSTTTDTTGKYSFSFVPLGSVTVNASDTNGNQGQSTGLVTATNQTISLNIQYLGQGTVTGTVLDGLGNPVPGATVSLRKFGLFSQTQTATANSLGVYSFSNIFIGPISLFAQSPTSSDGGTANTAINTNAQTITQNITLQPTANITGIIYRADGKTPVANANVYATGTAQSTQANASGAYTIVNIPLGSNYQLVATDPNSADEGAAGFSLGTAGATVPVNLNMLGLGTVNVTVVDGAGNPSPGALIYLQTAPPFNLITSAVADSNGLYTLSPELGGYLTVNATSATTALSGTSAGTLTANGTLNVKVMLQSFGTIQGTVLGLDNVTPISGAVVYLDGGTPITTDSTGTFSFSNVAVGSHSLLAQDYRQNFLGASYSVNLNSQGQVVKQNIVIIGRGTVSGQITNPDGSPAPMIPVTVASATGNDSNSYGTASDANGNYSIPNVPIGPFSVVAQSFTTTTNSYGTGNGVLNNDGSTAVVNIQLSTTLVPTATNFTDANGLQYLVRENGGIFDGSFNVFAGDDVNNQGGSVLSVSTGNKPATKFLGAEFSTASLNGRQLSIEQDGVDGVNITRRVYVPQDGYFARYLELVTNPGAQTVTVGLTLSDYFRQINQDIKINGVTFQNESLPQIINTSSGDTTFSIANPNPDYWITFGGPTNQDPFLPDGFADTLIPTVSDIFSGPGAALVPTSAGYIPDSSNTFSTLSETYQVSVPAGATVGILHFLSQENLNQAGVAAATRLVQLPPEALAGLSQSDLAAIQNFVVPPQGVSTLAALPAITNSVTGTVYGSDNLTPVPYAEVFLQSTDPIYARTYVLSQADSTGNFLFTGTPGGLAIPNEPFNLYAYHPTSTTSLTPYCAQFSQQIGGSCAVISPTASGSFSPNTTSASQNVAFTNTGIITGTILQGPNVLNVAGNVTISGGPLNIITLPIAADGTYTVTGVLPGTYTVVASVTNTLLTGSISATVTAGNTTTANINIVPSGNVTGTVTRSDGTLAINDIVYLRTANQGVLSYQVDTAGHYLFTDIPAGTYTLNCYDNVTQSAVTAQVVITTNATVTQNLQLLSTGTVTGSVSSNDGSSVVGLTVTLTSTTTNGTQTLTTTSGTGGAFTFNAVNPGAIVVSSTNSEGLKGSGQTYLPTAGQTVSANIQLIASANVTGTVFQGDGVTPAAGIQVSISPAPLTGSSVSTTNASGVYNFTSEPFGNFVVSASNPANGDQGQSSGAVEANGQLRTININLNGFGSVTVNVLDANSNPVSGASVTLQTGNINHNYTASTNTSGVASFPSVFAGSFFVSATNPVNNLSGYGSGSVAFNGTATVTVRLQALATLSGTVFQPDGITPAAGVTVQLNPNYGPTTTTNAAGAYQFANLNLGNYSVNVHDAAGILRASANNIQLQNNAQVVTQNLTENGLGSVSGVVTNIDGSRAVNLSFTISNASGTFSQNGMTAGDGTYSVPAVPVGAFSITLYGLPANETGYGNSTIPQNGAQVTLNIQIQSSTVTLPTTLLDADSFPYIIQPGGTYTTSRLGGLVPFYYSQPLTLYQGSSAYGFGCCNSYGSPTTVIQTLNGQQIEINEPSLLGLSVTRKIYVPTTGYFSRRLEVLSNPTSSPITVQVQIGGGGYDRYATSYPQVITSSGGTATVNSSTLWTVDNSGINEPYPQNQPAVANIFAGPKAAIGMQNVAQSENCTNYYYGQTNYCFLTWTYQYQPVTIPANGEAAFLFFTAQESTNAQATDAAQRLVQLPAEALAGITPTDLASIQNFVVPTSPLPAVTPPPTNVVEGTVTASDGVSPVPQALVFFNSTDLLYGFGESAQADNSGNYLLPSVLASSYTTYAIDPSTQSTSPNFTGTIPANTVVQTQNITFNNTGVVQGTVTATGAGTFTGGSVTIVYQCSNGNYYCQGPTTTFGPNGQYQFLTVQAGSIQISAQVTTPQGGTITIPPNYGAYTINVPAQQTTQFNFVVPPTGNITGQLTNADGTPATGITVNALPSSTGIGLNTTTDANGNFAFSSITLDTYTISATDPTTGSTVSAKTTITQDTTNTVNLQFLGKDTINIHVTFVNGNPAPQSTTVYAATSTNSTYNFVGGTDANGNLSLSNIPTGTLSIRTYYPNGNNFYSTTPFTVTGTNQTENVTAVLPPAGTVSGTVVNADGTPAADLYVTAADLLNQYSNDAETDSVGSFAFSPVPAQRPIKFTAQAYSSAANRYLTATATQTLPSDGSTATVNLRFPGLATVVITVLTNGTPVNTGGQIYLHALDNSYNPAQNLNDNGTSTFTNVAENTYLAYFTYYGEGSLGSTTFTVGPSNDNGTVNVTINTTPTGTIQGQVFAADGTTALSQNVGVTFTDVLTGVYVGANFNGSQYTVNPATNGTQGYSITASVNVDNTPVTQTFTGNISTAGQNVTQNFTLPIGVISGTVFLNDGVTPVPYASVFGSQINYSIYATADANGNYQLVGPIAGAMNIVATDQNGVSGNFSINVPTATSILTGQNVSLGAVGSVMGVAYDNNNNLITNSSVEIDSSGNNGGFTTYTSTDSNGNYIATDIPVGNITVTVTEDVNNVGTVNFSNTGILVNNGDAATINIGNPGVGSVFGTVYDEYGNPSQGATVTLTSDFAGSQPVTVTTDVNGMYNASGVVFGNITAVATIADGFVTPSITAPLSSPTVPVEIDINNPNPGVVSGLAIDVNGDPIANANVALYDTTDPNSYTTSSTDQNGNFYFGSIDPGMITVQVLDQNNNVLGQGTGSLGYGGDLTINIQTNSVGDGMSKPANGSPRTKAALTPPAAPTSTGAPAQASTAQQARPASRPVIRRSQPAISQLPAFSPAAQLPATQSAALQGVHP